MFAELATDYLLPVLAQETAAFAVRYFAAQMLNGAASRAEAPRRSVRRSPRGASSTEVVSDTPGRARLRVLGLRGSATRAAELAHRCYAVAGVISVEANSLTGTLLVRYAPDTTTLARIRATLQSWLGSSRRRRSARGSVSSGRTLTRIRVRYSRLFNL
jgi:hypothetical protein